MSRKLPGMQTYNAYTRSVNWIERFLTRHQYEKIESEIMRNSINVLKLNPYYEGDDNEALRRGLETYK